MQADSEAPRSRVILVAGSGRSGTSSVAGSLKHLGLGIPQPEVQATRANPRGHFEPKWVVDLHMRLMRRAGVRLTDGRPESFALSENASLRPEVLTEVSEWLTGQLNGHRELVIKDPRNAWFLPMWTAAAEAADADVSFLTMLRHPAEVVGSKYKYYKTLSDQSARVVQTTQVATWVNVSLHCERVTRGRPRAFLPYVDLLEDWRASLLPVAEQLRLSLADGFTAEGQAAVDEFIDTDLHRVRTTWDEVDCVPQLQAVAEDVWAQMDLLVQNGGQDEAAQARLDELQDEYSRLYADAEAVAQSSIQRARQAGRRQGARERRAEQTRTAYDESPSQQAGAPSEQSPAGRLARSGRALGRRARGWVQRRR